jgi:ABC-type Mn2+/Zn2+ transport system ATPase subunit
MSLTWNNLVLGHRGRRGLNQPFSGRLEDGGIYAIVGPNGCGKSTLLKTWLGLVTPVEGSVFINGQPPELRKTPLAYVPQSQQVNQFFQINVLDFVLQGYGRHLPESEKAIQSAMAALVQWDLSAESAQSFHLLSGGQKTRALIARALLSNPKMLFLDEPLANLDSCCQKQLMDTLHHLAHTEQICVVMVDHHFDTYETLLSAQFVFERAHNDEVCSIKFEPRDDTCCRVR